MRALNLAGSKRPRKQRGLLFPAFGRVSSRMLDNQR